MISSKVSVVIPTYNYGCFVSEAIDSALGQTHRPEEIIVVDDGSTDGTEEAVNVFVNKVKYLKQTNSGVCAARNRGVAESTGEYIAFLDADDIWEPTKIEKQLAKFAEDADIGLVHCGMREFDSETRETLAVHDMGMEGSIAEELLLWERPAMNVSGSAIMISRKAFEDVGGFDPELKCGEDWDLCYRIAMKYKVGFVPEPLVNYRSHGAAAHRNVAEMERGMGRFYEKAFDTDDPNVLALKRRAMGNYHRVLAGSYFRAGQYSDFARHAMKSIGYRPSNLGYFAKFPLRRLRRQ